MEKNIEKLFTLRQKYKDENIEVAQLLVNLLLKKLYGENIRKYNKGNFARKSEYWMMTEYDERVEDYWKIVMENILLK